MRILYDGRVFQFQKAGGINRYFAELISALPSEWEPTIAGTTDLGEQAPVHPGLKTTLPPDFRPRRFRKQFQDRWWKPRLLRSADVFHPTYYDLTCGLRFHDFKCPVVVTVHDLIYAKFSALMEGSAEIVKNQRVAVERADRIVCVSKSTERDLIEWMPAAEGKIEVIHHGSSFPPVQDNGLHAPRAPNFLFVGGRGGYKNFLFLLRAFANAALRLPKIRLRVVGSRLNDEERWQMHFLGISDRIDSVVHPDEAKLRSLYRESVALLYPSRYEGFGIPPLEAMSCGTVPVTSNTSSLPEVMGDAGIMLDPSDEAGWAECIVQLAAGGPRFEALVQKGLAQAMRFRWADSVQRHVALYRSLV